MAAVSASQFTLCCLFTRIKKRQNKQNTPLLADQRPQRDTDARWSAYALTGILDLDSGVGVWVWFVNNLSADLLSQNLHG